MPNPTCRHCGGAHRIEHCPRVIAALSKEANLGRPAEERKCRVCGANFSTTSYNKMYCSKRCKATAVNEQYYAKRSYTALKPCRHCQRRTSDKNQVCAACRRYASRRAQ